MSPPGISTRTGERIVALLFDLNAQSHTTLSAGHARSRGGVALRTCSADGFGTPEMSAIS
jgi:hypothetical protein